MSEAEAREALVRVLVARAASMEKPMTMYEAMVVLGRYCRETLVPAINRLFAPLLPTTPPLPENVIMPPLWTTEQLQRMMPPLPPLSGWLMKKKEDGN